jgi:hypothetical protein
VKAISLFIIAAATMFVFVACGDDKKGDKAKDGQEVAKCDQTNNVETVLVDSAAIDFKPTTIFANYNKTWKTYRVVFINYDMASFGDFKSLEAGQIKMVVGISNPEGDVFKPGKYTYAGNENGKNQALFTLVIDSTSVYHNYADLENPGEINIISIDEKQICGTAHLFGQGGNEIKVSFSAAHTEL